MMLNTGMMITSSFGTRIATFSIFLTDDEILVVLAILIAPHSLAGGLV